MRRSGFPLKGAPAPFGRPGRRLPFASDELFDLHPQAVRRVFPVTPAPKPPIDLPVDPAAPVAVLFVCLGNICRSPTAEGVFRHRLARDGLAGRVATDSAGTGDWHIGKPPHRDTMQAAKRRGYDLSSLRARLVTPADFARFPVILAMDRSNLGNLARLQPRDFAGHLGLFLDFAPDQPIREMPDPYGGEPEGFDQVLDLVEEDVEGLLRSLRGKGAAGRRV